MTTDFGRLVFATLTAGVALLAGAAEADAQSAAGAGSFPQSFLIPGTNTSLSIYGVIKTTFRDNFGAQHDSDAGAPAGTSVAFHIGQLATQGPGAAGGNSRNTQQNAIHGGFKGFVNPSTLTFETRTPSSLGEVKTVLALDMNLLNNQANYIGTTTSTTKPSVGSGNTDAPRMRWAYATIGPWLIGQYNTNYADATLFPDVSDAGFNPGHMNTANIRQPQVRYTYLAGNGLAFSGSVEYHEGGTLYLGAAASQTAATVSSFVSDNTDIGGVINLPALTAGVTWDQPWGHLSSHIGVMRNEVRNTQGGVNALAPNQTANTSNNIKKWAWAISAGGYINTWGKDRLKLIANYSRGASNFLTDLSPTGGGNMFCNGYVGSCELISEFAVATSYTHVFSPNWRSTAAFGIGFFSKPSNAAGLTNVASGATAAQLASLEKRHLASQLNVVYSPLPGLTDIYLEWDHWDRWVQATNTHGWSQSFSVGFNVFW